MKKVLFLDDDHHRIAVIRERAEQLGFDLAVVETADECIAELKNGTFDLVMLDHDLGGETYCDSSRMDCGMEVVRWIKANGSRNGGYIVHTMNETAAAMMFMELNALGHRVRQGGFGGSRFEAALYEMLEIPRPRGGGGGKRSKSLGERLTAYFRSLRLGK